MSGPGTANVMEKNLQLRMGLWNTCLKKEKKKKESTHYRVPLKYSVFKTKFPPTLKALWNITHHKNLGLLTSCFKTLDVSSEIFPPAM